MQTLTEERRVYINEMLLKHPIPCMVFCRGIEPGDVFLKKAVESNVPVFSASKPTSDFSAEIIRHKTMSSLDQLKCSFTFSDPAFSHDQNTDADRRAESVYL